MTLVPGTGEDGFVPLADGDTILVTMGPTSGWYVSFAGLVEHTTQNVWVDARVTAMEVDPPYVLGGGDVGDSLAIALVAYDDLSCSGRFWGHRAVLDDYIGAPELVCGIHGQQVEVAITVTEIASPADDARSVSASAIGPAEVDDVNHICE